MTDTRAPPCTYTTRKNTTIIPVYRQLEGAKCPGAIRFSHCCRWMRYISMNGEYYYRKRAGSISLWLSILPQSTSHSEREIDTYITIRCMMIFLHVSAFPMHLRIIQGRQGRKGDILDAIRLMSYEEYKRKTSKALNCRVLDNARLKVRMDERDKKESEEEPTRLLICTQLPTTQNDTSM